jgi:hypothetical protein
MDPALSLGQWPEPRDAARITLSICLPCSRRTARSTAMPDSSVHACARDDTASNSVAIALLKPDGSALLFAGPTPPSSLSGAGSPLQEPAGAGVVVGRLRRNSSASLEARDKGRQRDPGLPTRCWPRSPAMSPMAFVSVVRERLASPR